MFNKIKPDKKWIIYDDNPLMKQKIHDVDFPLTNSDIEAIEKMISYVDASYEDNASKYNIQPGIGIAAIQIGYPKKIIYIHLDDEENNEQKYLLANPKIIKKSINNAYLKNGEGCLSVKKSIPGYVIRKEIVVVKAINLFTNKEIEIKASGILSMCLQHEIDHNDNKFYYDSINNENPYFVNEKWTKL